MSRLEAIIMPLGGHRMKRAGIEQQAHMERGRLPIAGNEGSGQQQPSSGGAGQVASKDGVVNGMAGFYGGMTQGVKNVVKNNSEKKKDDMVDMTEFI
jgi:hypothetical protein